MPSPGFAQALGSSIDDARSICASSSFAGTIRTSLLNSKRTASGSS